MAQFSVGMSFALIARALVRRDAPSHLPSQRALLSIPSKGPVIARTGFVERFLNLLSEGGSMDERESQLSERLI